MKISDYIVDFLSKEGISVIFELIGGQITHLTDSTYDRSDIRCFSVHHEQAAAFSAEGYARCNGNFGVAMATSGPGALNLVTGIGSCYFDSVPCLFITGQVNTYEYKFNRPIRQIGFQETDIVKVVQSITKYAKLVTEPSKIRFYLEKAIYLAKSGRPGPVLLDIPMNIQRADIDPTQLPSFYMSNEYKEIEKNYVVHYRELDKVFKLIEQAKRPLILAGGGIRTANAVEGFRFFVEKTSIPVVTSLMGLDAIPHSNAEFVGLIGSYGNRYSNITLANCDLLLVFGSRLDSRQTGTRPMTFARDAKIVHVDIDPMELNTKIKADLAINCHMKEFFNMINVRLSKLTTPCWDEWKSTISAYKRRFQTEFLNSLPGQINPNRFFELLSDACGENDIIVLDVGQNQMWTAQSFVLKEHQRMLISGGMGAMGFAIPAAIGAAKTLKDGNVIVISGDGGIQINIQELDTIYAHDLPIKIFVMNNKCLGMVRQFQDLYFDGRRQSTAIGYHCPDLVAVSSAYGIYSESIDSPDNVIESIARVLKSRGPAMLNVELSSDSCVEPKLVVNKPIEDMSPHLDKEELRELMLIDLVYEKK